MRSPAERRPEVTQKHGGPGGDTPGPTAINADLAPIVGPLDDIWAWTGVHLADGRVISLAWLRGYPGAVASPPAARRGA